MFEFIGNLAAMMGGNSVLNRSAIISALKEETNQPKLKQEVKDLIWYHIIPSIEKGTQNDPEYIVRLLKGTVNVIFLENVGRSGTPAIEEANRKFDAALIAYNAKNQSDVTRTFETCLLAALPENESILIQDENFLKPLQDLAKKFNVINVGAALVQSEASRPHSPYSR